MSEKILRPVIFFIAAALHLFVIFYLVFDLQKSVSQEPENARVMKLIDIDELPPPPPPPPPQPPKPEPEIPQVETIAETMIETDIPPEEEVVEAGTLITEEPVVEPVIGEPVIVEPVIVQPVIVEPVIIEPEKPEDDYLPMHLVSKPPEFNEREIAADLVYPAIARSSGIEGRVILELFVDRTGAVQSITVLLEEPQGRGFGEAAVRAFTGRKGTPAMANGEPVSIRYRYPINFRLR